MRAPGAGAVAITGERDGGNQLTCVGAPTVSHGRGAAATSIVPVAGCVPSETALAGALSACAVRSPGLP